MHCIDEGFHYYQIRLLFWFSSKERCYWVFDNDNNGKQNEKNAGDKNNHSNKFNDLLNPVVFHLFFFIDFLDFIAYFYDDKKERKKNNKKEKANTMK